MDVMGEMRPRSPNVVCVGGRLGICWDSEEQRVLA
jgi:hypothetical protein